MLQKFSVFQPNAWDNSIVPINILHKIVNNLNEVIDVVNAIEDTGFERAKEYTDSQITIVNSNIATLNSALSSLSRVVSNLMTTVQSLDNRETEHYNVLTYRIGALDNRVTEVRAYLKNYTDFEVLQLKNYLENEIKDIVIKSRKAFELWGLLTLEERITYIQKLYEVIITHPHCFFHYFL